MKKNPMQNKVNLILEKVMQLYRSEYRLLQTIQINYPNSIGTFTLDIAHYTKHIQEELSAANFITLFNQVALVSLAFNLVHRNIPEANDFDLPLEGVEYFVKNVLIRKFDQINFDKIILKEQELTYHFKIQSVINKIPSHNMLFFNLMFSACNNSHSAQGVYCYPILDN